MLSICTTRFSCLTDDGRNSNPSRGPQLFWIMIMALGITWIHYWNQKSSGDCWIRNHNFYIDSWIFSIFPHVTIVWCISSYLVNKNHKNQFRNLKIKPRFQNHVDKISELQITHHPLPLCDSVAVTRFSQYSNNQYIGLKINQYF